MTTASFGSSILDRYRIRLATPTMPKARARLVPTISMITAPTIARMIWVWMTGVVRFGVPRRFGRSARTVPENRSKRQPHQRRPHLAQRHRPGIEVGFAQRRAARRRLRRLRQRLVALRQGSRGSEPGRSAPGDWQRQHHGKQACRQNRARVCVHVSRVSPSGMSALERQPLGGLLSQLLDEPIRDLAFVPAGAERFLDWRSVSRFSRSQIQRTSAGVMLSKSGMCRPL